MSLCLPVLHRLSAPFLLVLRWPSHFTEIFTFPHMPCQDSFHRYHGDLKKKIGSCYPCLCKTYTNSHCILNKIQIPLRSHFLSCLSQSLFSNVPDQLSIHIKILASGPLHFLAPLPGVHFSLNLIRLFPSINQNSVLSRCLITCSL